MYNNWTVDDVCQQLEANDFDYAVSIFSNNEITGDLLPMITEDHLTEMGIESIGKRLLLLQWIRETAGFVAPQSSSAKPANRQPSVDFGADEYEAPPPSQPKLRQESSPNRSSQPKRAQTASAPKDENVPKCKRDHDKMVEQIRAARKLAAYEKAVQEGRAVGPPPELPPIEEP